MSNDVKVVQWKKNIKTNIDKLLRGSSVMNERLALLEKLLPYLSKESFIYKSQSESYIGSEYLLKWYKKKFIKKREI